MDWRKRGPSQWNLEPEESGGEEQAGFSRDPLEWWWVISFAEFFLFMLGHKIMVHFTNQWHLRFEEIQ